MAKHQITFDTDPLCTISLVMLTCYSEQGWKGKQNSGTLYTNISMSRNLFVLLRCLGTQHGVLWHVEACCRTRQKFKNFHCSFYWYKLISFLILQFVKSMDPVLLNDKLILYEVRTLGTGSQYIEITYVAICLKRLRKIMECFSRDRQDLSQFRIGFFPRRITDDCNFAVQFHKNSLRTIFAVLSYIWIKHDLKCTTFLSRSCGKYLK